MCWRNLSDVVRIATRHRRTSDQYSWKIKSLIMSRFSSAFRVAQHLRSVDSKTRIQGDDSRTSRRRSGRSRFTLSDTGSASQLVGEFDGQPNPATIANLTLLGASKTYHLDDGVPFPDESAVWPAYASNIPEGPGDPEKYLRASAFSGWISYPKSTQYDFQLDPRISLAPET